MSDLIDQYTIRPIPGSARHGSARDLLPFWFTVNASVYTIGLGVFAAEFRLGLWPTIAAIVAGAAVGGAFMAAHSAQGPRLGVPQLVQSRAQFGFYGALLPNAAIWLLLLSTLVAADVTAGGTLAGLWHISLAQGVMVVCFVAWLLAVFGYRILHNASRVIAVAALIMAGVLLARLAIQLGAHRPGDRLKERWHGAGARGAGHRRRGDHGGHRLCCQRDFSPAADRHHRSRRAAGARCSRSWPAWRPRSPSPIRCTRRSRGPVATAWNGLDISWLAGFIVAGGLYCLARPDRGARRDAAAIRLNRSI
jgi:hypothetical protein